MTDAEIKILATVAWKENRHGGIPGMTSIINIVQNRAAKHSKSVTEIIMAPKQFTSMSVASDPEYHTDPTKATGLDLTVWNAAKHLAQQAASGVLADLTNGATLYYAPKGIVTDKAIGLPNGAEVPFPKTWNSKVVQYVGTIAGQYFFIEM